MASVVFIIISCVYTGCAGPGLEPPDNNGLGPITGGTAGAAAGAGGNGGVGGASGVGGFGNAGQGGSVEPSGGVGGMNVGGAGGAGGVSGTSGAGMGGFGGVGGGAGDTASDPDAGANDGGAPMMECEEGRETVELTVLNTFEPYCLLPATDEALTHSDDFAVAITMGDGAETKWPARKDMGADCADDEAFILNGSLDLPRIELCPALCEAVAAALESGVTVELIYGCDPPE